jgi:hypothetical protein
MRHIDNNEPLVHQIFEEKNQGEERNEKSIKVTDVLPS